MVEAAFIYDAVRTPRGKGRNGALGSTPALDLVVGLVDAVRDRNSGLLVDEIEDLVLGIVSPVGEQGGNLARTAVLAAGLPETVAGLQLNRFCASGLEAVNIAAAKVRGFGEKIILAGGVESMSRVPLGSDGGTFAADPGVRLGWEFVPQGISADLIATLESFGRDEVDAFAVESQSRADAAWRRGAFDRSVIPVLDATGRTVLDTDEHRRPGSTLESLGHLSPAFAAVGAERFDEIARRRYPDVGEISHVHTAGNSSGIVDGAALVLVGSEEAGARSGLVPRARIVASVVVGSEPTIMLTGPTAATQRVLDRAGLGLDDIDLFEVNEAFAAVVLKWMRDTGVSHERVNVNGGAISLGHPLGATGAMLVGIALDELERRGGRRALITLCAGAGMGIATIIERV